MRLRLTLIMLRGRIEYHGLSCLQCAQITEGDVRTEQMNGYAFALWAHVDSSTTKTPSCHCSPPE